VPLDGITEGPAHTKGSSGSFNLPGLGGSASLQAVRSQLHVEDRHEAVTVSAGALRFVVSRMVSNADS
jgi:hypothetical protein